MSILKDMGFVLGRGARIGADDIAALATRVDPIDGAGWFSPSTKGRSWQLPFYSDVVLIELSDLRWEPRGTLIAYLLHAGSLFRLNGTAPPIHAVNTAAPLRLNDENLLAYLRFFGLFVHGEEGPFVVCDEARNPLLPDENRNEGLSAVLFPADLLGRTDDGRWQARATICYSDAVFAARFQIDASGDVEMVEDVPLMNNLVSGIELPLSVTRCGDEGDPDR